MEDVPSSRNTAHALPYLRKSPTISPAFIVSAAAPFWRLSSGRCSVRGSSRGTNRWEHIPERANYVCFDSEPLPCADVQLNSPLRTADPGGARHPQSAGKQTAGEADLNAGEYFRSGWTSDVQFTGDGPRSHAEERKAHPVASIVSA
jgi:hypothetical protein